MFFHRTHDLALPLFLVMGLAHQYGILVSAGHVLDAADGGGEKGFGQLGQDDADGECLALLKVNGCLVWLIFQLCRQLLHPHFGTQTDAGMVMKGPGHSGCGDI